MKFHEILPKLRKDRKISQEDLAEQLGISRQAIAKWESGAAFPDIQNLIRLSEIFYISIDQLVKEQPACSKQVVDAQVIPIKPLLAFIKEANDHTYAAGMNKVNITTPSTHMYTYMKDTYTYIDRFVGGTQFFGQVLVTEDSIPIWSMQYSGHTLSDQFSSDFLKEVLLHMPSTLPIRGANVYTQGKHIYHNEMQGDFSWYHGKEYIYYKDAMVYEGKYMGGYVK